MKKLVCCGNAFEAVCFRAGRVSIPTSGRNAFHRGIETRFKTYFWVERVSSWE